MKRSEKKEFISPLLLSIFLTLTMCCFLFPYSIEFDRDFDYFAIAGVTKKIKVLYEKQTILFLISLSGDIKGRKSLFYINLCVYRLAEGIYLNSKNQFLLVCHSSGYQGFKG